MAKKAYNEYMRGYLKKYRSAQKEISRDLFGEIDTLYKLVDDIKCVIAGHDVANFLYLGSVPKHMKRIQELYNFLTENGMKDFITFVTQDDIDCYNRILFGRIRSVNM